jgi:hypothetical protein
MLGSAVNEQGFERREEITRRTGGALMGLSVGAKFGAQFFDDRRGARYLSPTEF